MKKFQTVIIIVLAIIIPIFLIYKEYNPIETKSHWTYAGEHSVFAWGDEEASHLCKTGKAQSPIDVPKESPKGTSNYKFSYTETEFEGKNNGHAIEYKPKKDSPNTLTLNGEVYSLVQFHFHNPSEHAVGGVLYPMEVHFVHKTSGGKIAVVAAMIEVNEKPTLKDFWQEGKKDEKNKKTVNLSSIVQGGGKHYKGSLTTPPCSEDIEWLVLDQHQTMTQEEVNRYRKIMGSETNRPVQPINGREVTQA